MINKLIATEKRIELLLLRVSLGVVLLGHGVQKAFGWFGGFGWSNTINYFTGTVGIPAILGGFIILIETIGALLLITGFAGRINAALMGIVIIGAFFKDHLANGFFMNWFGNQKGEGYEFDILFVAIAIVLSLKGSGALSIDRWISSKTRAEKTSQKIKLAY
jgi:putative oxidoreductase